MLHGIISQGLVVKRNGMLMSLVILLQQYPFHCVLWGKWKYEEVFRKIKPCKYRCFRDICLYVFKGLFGFWIPLDLFILSKHVGYISHYFNKGNNKSSQKICLPQEGLNLEFILRELNFVDCLNPIWIYLDSLLRYYIPQHLPFFHRK